MKNKYINPTLPRIWYGGDLNPEQWDFSIWEKDFKLMKEAHCNVMSLGIFAWSRLEPAEGQFDFSWLDTIMNRLAEQGMFAALATPSAAHPAWMSRKYPEILRLGPDNITGEHGFRVNFCPTSSVYREKCRIIAEELAKRYADHKALILWHISNEYYKECHCPRCSAAFKDYLKQKYVTLENLNHEWWTSHWSHTYSSWDEIGSAHLWPKIEWSVFGQRLDWCRFTVDQQVACARNEIDTVKRYTPHIPVTTNGHMTFSGTTDWSRFAPYLDVMSLDSYPHYQGREKYDLERYLNQSFEYDLFRSLKSKPFMRMEGNPAGGVGKRQIRPGILKLTALQALAHGADTIQFFQWRDGRGGTEKFHGAMVEHEGSTKQRSFKDIVHLGDSLNHLTELTGTSTHSECAIVWDKENYWSLELSSTARGEEKGYLAASLRHYKALIKQGVSIDVIPMDFDYSKYKLLILPLLYLQKRGIPERIKKFVHKGGTLVISYYSGYTNENDLVFEGGFPSPFRDLLGIWSEQLDGLSEGEQKAFTMAKNNPLGMGGTFLGNYFCDILVNEGCEDLAHFDEDFYKGQPALTYKQYGKGQSYYLGTDPESAFYQQFYQQLTRNLSLFKAPVRELPLGTGVGIRLSETREYYLFYSFLEKDTTLVLTREDCSYLLNEKSCGNQFILPKHCCIILFSPR